MKIDDLRALARAAKDRADAATPGPWRANDELNLVTSMSHPLLKLSEPYHRQCVRGTGQDAAFIASARTDLPILADAVLALADRLALAEAVCEDLEEEQPHKWRCDLGSHEDATCSCPWGKSLKAWRAAKGEPR